MSSLSGFGNHFASESAPGALPVGRNSPQRVPYGLYTEQLSGTAFTAPRADNRRSWLYRRRPSAAHPPFSIRPGLTFIRSGPFNEMDPTPNRLRWDPVPVPPLLPTDFIDGLYTYGGNGDPADGSGLAIHGYTANCSMVDKAFFDADGELLVVPQEGALRFVTEFGPLDIEPQQIIVIPRGVRFRVELLQSHSRGYVCENYGAAFQLPELGAIGANGLANPRDFESPAASTEADRPTEIIQKFGGRLWTTSIRFSPFDVVAWHGNLVPYRYDLRRFNTLGTVSFDHPDPSIFTVLTSPSSRPGTANCDFVIFPPRWLVAEETFRPPWFHRNVMSEFMGLIHGAYDAKVGGFVPGGASLHNCMSGHGPDQASYAKAIGANLEPVKAVDTLAFMFESRRIIRPTRFALETPLLQSNYDECWSDFQSTTVPS